MEPTHHMPRRRATHRMPLRCKAQSRRAEGQCRAWAVLGADVCSAHGGRAPQVMAAADERLARSRAEQVVAREVARLGIRRTDASPAELLVEQVHEAAGNVEALRVAVASLDPAAEGKPHAFWALYAEERDRLVRTAKVCPDAGVEVRLVEMAEAQTRHQMAELHAVWLEAVEDPDLALSAEQRQLAGVAMARAIRRRRPEGIAAQATS